MGNHLPGQNLRHVNPIPTGNWTVYSATESWNMYSTEGTKSIFIWGKWVANLRNLVALVCSSGDKGKPGRLLGRECCLQSKIAWHKISLILGTGCAMCIASSVLLRPLFRISLLLMKHLHYKDTVPKIQNKYSQKWNCTASFQHTFICERFIYSLDRCA